MCYVIAKNKSFSLKVVHITSVWFFFPNLPTQGIKADKFQKYDYGPDGNMKRYNQVIIFIETLQIIEVYNVKYSTILTIKPKFLRSFLTH